MANPIKKDELVTQDALEQLDKMAVTLTTIADNLAKAKTACQGWAVEEGKAATATGDNVEELTKANARISQLEDTIKKLTAAEKENNEQLKKNNEEKRKYKKLSEEEAAAVRSLAQGWDAYAEMVKKGHTVTLRNKEDIDIQNKSYNELYQTYNALKDALNKLTTEQRTNTDVGKYMTAQANAIRETLNGMQKSVGNYTLQVGKYRAAFDGLGYSFQQILREAPSALNLNQFFLAISNNLPMFFDQVTRYTDTMKEELAELQDKTNKTAEEIARMGELTKATGNKLNTVIAVIKRLKTAIFSLQGAVLLGTLLLRFLPKIVEWVKTLTNHVQTIVKYIKREFAEAKIMSGIISDVTKTRVELERIVEILPNLKQGTEEYANAMSRVKELTGGMLDDMTAAPDKVREITAAYLAQAEQLAKNKYVLDQISKSTENQAKRELIKGQTSLAGVAGVLGFEEGSDEYKELEKKFNAAISKGRTAWDNFWRRSNTAVYNRDQKEIREYWAYINNLTPTIDQKDIEAMWDKFYKPLPTNNNNGSGKGETERYSFEEVPDKYWDAEEALIRYMQVGYQQELSLQELYHQKAMQENDNWLAERNNALYNNLMTDILQQNGGDKDAAGLIYNEIVGADPEHLDQLTEQAQEFAYSFWYNIQEGQRQHNAIMQDLVRENGEKINSINTKYAEMDRQVIVEEQMGWIEKLEEQYKVQDNNRKRRARTIKEEELNNIRVADSIQKIAEEIAALEALKLTQPESIEQRTKRIGELNKQMEKLRQQFDFTKQLSNYKNPWDILQRNGAFNAGPDMKKGILGSILGEKVVGNMSGDQIDSAFETWLDNLGSSISTWYDTTMGYINDLIGAYVDLANAKAEAAKEATEAAQEEYEKEKALLEAGYASRVEATWAEYQEKKAAQEKAEADAKAAAQAQKELNEMQTAGSMIVAAANIWKTFSGMGPVGIALAAVATAGMFAAFVASKAKAAEVSKYGEGGFEVLEGGSHASGHDIDLGVKNRKGRRMKAEGKEGLGIFSRRAMAHYGANNIEAMVNSVNRLEFEGNAAKRMSLERSVGMAVLSAPRTDLRRLENSVDKLVGYGSRNVTVLPDGTVREIRKNGVVTIKKG